MHQGEWRSGLLMMLKNGLDRSADGDCLARVPKQVADHPHIAVLRQFDQDGDVRSAAVERRMHRMMRALIAVDAATPLDLFPGQVERVTAMTDPLRSPLP